MTVHQTELRLIAREAVREAMQSVELQTMVSNVVKITVAETLVKMGQDVFQPFEAQADAIFLRKLRKGAGSVGLKVVVLSVGMLMTSLGGVLALGLQAYFKLPH